MAPRRWRNGNCLTPGLDPKNGTEFDWMTFVYNLDKTPPAAVPPVAPIGLSNGIFRIYAQMCNGGCDSSDNVAFVNFAASASTLFGASDPRTVLVTTLGDGHGVSEILTP